MIARLFVCTTCARYAPLPPSETTPGERLALAAKARAADEGNDITIRAVVCLNGCPHPCTAALREPGKAVIRFANLTAEDAPALLEAARLYARSHDGDLPADMLPETLRNKVGCRVAAQAA